MFCHVLMEGPGIHILRLCAFKIARLHWKGALHLGACMQLRAQRDRVEDLVDDVVQSYHNGFNKAIHNYSRILRLFSESKDQASPQIPPVV